MFLQCMNNMRLLMRMLQHMCSENTQTNLCPVQWDELIDYALKCHGNIRLLLMFLTWNCNIPSLEIVVLTVCCRLNIFEPLKFVCRSLIPNVMVFSAGAFEGWLGHEGGALMNRICTGKEETPKSSWASSTRWGHREKTFSLNLEMGSPQTSSLLVPSSWTSQPPELWEINVI